MLSRNNEQRIEKISDPDLLAAQPLNLEKGYHTVAYGLHMDVLRTLIILNASTSSTNLIHDEQLQILVFASIASANLHCKRFQGARLATGQCSS